VLQWFVRAPGDELHGFEIIRRTGIPSSTLYPVLRVLAEERGFLVSRWESIDPVAVGRPRRRLYRLDPHATGVAQAALREHLDHVSREPRPQRMLREA